MENSLCIASPNAYSKVAGCLFGGRPFPTVVFVAIYIYILQSFHSRQRPYSKVSTMKGKKFLPTSLKLCSCYLTLAVQQKFKQNKKKKTIILPNSMSINESFKNFSGGMPQTLTQQCFKFSVWFTFCHASMSVNDNMLMMFSIHAHKYFLSKEFCLLALPW